MNEKAIALIKKWESCKLTAYEDISGCLTIGWGHTKGVTPGMTITQEQADQYLLEDMEPCIKAVDSWDFKYSWTENECAALISFAYNLGPGAIDQVTSYGTRDKSTIADKMLLYYNAGGKKVQGLVNRRQEEHDLFLTPDSIGIREELVSIRDQLERILASL